MGYHISPISKGELGYISKIQEELNELQDAYTQGNKILQLCELADLIGAIDHFLLQHFPNMSIDDLRQMANATARAFASGERK